MSWDVTITKPDPATCDHCGGSGEIREYLEVEYFTEGGTYPLGGSTDADLNITYNYSPHYYRVLPNGEGLRGLNGLTVEEALPQLSEGVKALGTDEHPDYWKATEGNARRALVTLEKWCQLAIDSGIATARIEVS